MANNETIMTNETNKKPVSNLETEYLELNSRNAWPILYQQIRQECESFDFTSDESKKPQNEILNRYRDVAPYDHSRIVLNKGPYDYINANLLSVDKAHRKYILTQGPLPSTSGHFWLMVWEQKSKAIVMLNKVVEKEQIKCHQYWPKETDKPIKFDDVNLKVEFISQTQSTDYEKSVLVLTNLDNNESRQILHFHYISWPDFGVPQSPTAFLMFLNDIRESGGLGLDVGPPIIHCSAGIGRTGTFCLVDTCLMLIEENGLNSVDVRAVLLDMRKSRMGLIQTPDQLRFSYAAIIEGAKKMPPNALNGTATENNHYDLIDNIENLVNRNTEVDVIDEQDDEPPPLPPPRGESLSRNAMTDVMNDDWPVLDEEQEEEEPPNRPLPMEPANRPVDNSNVDDAYYDDYSEDERPTYQWAEMRIPSVRQRKQSKNQRLLDQVRDIKRRQEEAEDWQNMKRSLSIGTLIIGGGAAIAYCTYWYFKG